MSPVYFWNLVLTINSALLAIMTGVFVYSLGMLVITFDWRFFLFALVAWLVLIGIELIITALNYE